MKRILIAVTLTLSGLLLTGCGSGVEKDATYDEPADLAKAINGVSDLGCDEEYDYGVERYGWINIPCDHTAAALYESEHKRQEIYAKNPLEPGERRISGPNWSVTGAQFDIEELHDVLGGEMENPPGE